LNQPVEISGYFHGMYLKSVSAIL